MCIVAFGEHVCQTIDEVVCCIMQQVRLVIDGCHSASLNSVNAPSEDRRPCEAVGETPGDAEDVNVVVPLQLGGRMRPDAKYPTHVTRHGFRGCVKNLVHNGQVRLELSVGSSSSSSRSV